MYDPIYPPDFGVYSSNCCGDFAGTYAHYMGDYDTTVSDNNYVYCTWGDNRILTASTNGVTRYQADVRFIRVSWPP